ncbi:hypothetical protein KC19_5G112200 [Ceratodon purpureus]|uniref:Uncharacterized protein n=1 Tax=Ceratodon purpureus TaxID=3225 RepID=A0A8T0I219_CERPU|nr:hypothetical protein KC19_5G112200 [Ceratodon purpureus]
MPPSSERVEAQKPKLITYITPPCLPSSLPPPSHDHPSTHTPTRTPPRNELLIPHYKSPPSCHRSSTLIKQYTRISSPRISMSQPLLDHHLTLRSGIEHHQLPPQFNTTSHNITQHLATPPNSTQHHTTPHNAMEFTSSPSKPTQLAPQSLTHIVLPTESSPSHDTE